MMEHHSANSTSWSASGFHSEGTGGYRDLEGEPVYRWPEHKCYGCGATFVTAADLLTHLEDVHEAT